MSINAWPHLKRFNTVQALVDRAKELFKDRPEIQAKWVASVVTLRNETKNGWVADEKIQQPKVKGKIFKLPSA